MVTGPRRKARLRARAAALGLSIAVALLLGEGLARLAFGPPLERMGHHRLFCEFDPLLGWRKVPGFVGRHVTSEYDVEESMNALGLRGPEVTARPVAGSLRVLLLGDSFAEGYTVDFEETVGEVLARELSRRTGRPVEVINGGTGGYSTDQELLFFRRDGAPLAPHLTILLFHGNDPWFNAQDAYWRGAKPRFLLEGGRLTLTGVPVPEPAPEEPPPRTAVRRIKDALARTSSLYLSVRELAHRTGLRGGAPPGGPPDDFLVYAVTPDVRVEQAWAVTEALLGELRHEVEESGGRLVVASAPARVEVDAEAWADWLQTHGLEADGWDREAVRRRLAAVCRRQGLPLLDLTEAFRARQEAGGPRDYFPIDGHWTAAGHAVAGTSLAAWIDAEGRIPSP